MISLKIANLRSRLHAKGIRGVQLENTIRSAEQEISSSIMGAVEEAVGEVESYGVDIGADKFLAEIKLDSSTGYIQISTDSGQLDYSMPPVPMLPWLLNNAKMAKDGSRYKVIPVGISDQASSGNKFAAKDISAGLAALSSEPVNATNMAQQMAAAFGVAANVGKSIRQEPVSLQKPEFRVASDKQDAGSQWVLPSKNLDMGGVVMTVNDKIRSRIDAICDEVIDRYETEVADGMGNA